MALTLKFDDMIRRGEVRDYADLARLGHVSRARITQIMNLLNLAPEIQEEILEARVDETAHTAEHRFRALASMPVWSRQVAAWRRIVSCPPCGGTTRASTAKASCPNGS